MKANQILIDKGMLHHLPQKRGLTLINKTIETSVNLKGQLRFREGLRNEWDDMIDFMKQRIEEFKK